MTVSSRQFIKQSAVLCFYVTACFIPFRPMIISYHISQLSYLISSQIVSSDDYIISYLIAIISHLISSQIASVLLQLRSNNTRYTIFIKTNYITSPMKEISSFAEAAQNRNLLPITFDIISLLEPSAGLLTLHYIFQLI